MQVSRRLIAGFLAVVILTSGLIAAQVATAPGADASHNSWIYNKYGNSAPMFYAPCNCTYVKAWLPNNTKFWMECWVDHKWYTGNYSSNRWFYGTHQSGNYGYVHSSYVYYQKSVPHC